MQPPRPFQGLDDLVQTAPRLLRDDIVSSFTDVILGLWKSVVSGGHLSRMFERSRSQGEWFTVTENGALLSGSALLKNLPSLSSSYSILLKLEVLSVCGYCSFL